MTSAKDNVLALIKGGERFIFVYGDDQGSEVLLKIGQFASHPELNFTWIDAACLSMKVVRAEQRTEATR